MKESHDIVDIGVNLAHRSFQADRKQIVERAFARAVGAIRHHRHQRGGKLREGVRIAREYPGAAFFATAGVHPNDSRTRRTTPFRNCAASRDAPGGGGNGDAVWISIEISPHGTAGEVVQAQAGRGIAEAALCMSAMLDSDSAKSLAAVRRSVPAVLHCFTGTREELKIYLDLGGAPRITGWICDERRGTRLRKLVREIPLNRLMIETDAPLLVPRTMPSKTEGWPDGTATCLCPAGGRGLSWETCSRRWRRPLRKQREEFLRL